MNLIRTGLTLVAAAALAFPQAETARLKFEVAAVKPNTRGGRGMTIRPSPGGRLAVEDVTVRQLIRIAYGILDSNLRRSWLDRLRPFRHQREGGKQCRF
jgi:hypothetical protein